MMMVRLFRIFSILFLLTALPAGIASADNSQSSIPHFISQVHVVCQRGSVTINREYVQPHKMQAILNYLRTLETNGAADLNPERLMGDSFVITIYDSDGQRQIYRQRANRFLSKNSHPWKKIDPDQASRLYPLLLSMSTDKRGTQSVFTLRPL